MDGLSGFDHSRENHMRSFRSIAAIAGLCPPLVPTAAFTQDEFFDSGGVRIRYVEQGSGDPIGQWEN
jgi:hypothetical protein